MWILYPSTLKPTGKVDNYNVRQYFLIKKELSFGSRPARTDDDTYHLSKCPKMTKKKLCFGEEELRESFSPNFILTGMKVIFTFEAHLIFLYFFPTLSFLVFSIFAMSKYRFKGMQAFDSIGHLGLNMWAFEVYLQGLPEYL